MSRPGSALGILSLVTVMAALSVACSQAASPTATAPRPTAERAASPVAVQPTATTPASPQPKVRATVRLGLVGASSDVALFIAMEKGYFAEQALDIQSQTFGSAAQMVAPLGAGQLDVGGGNPSPGLFNAIQRDIPIRIVADKGRQSPGQSFEGLVVRKDLVDSGRFHNLADLKGMSVAVSTQGSSGEIVLDTALKQVGLSTRDLNMVALPFPDMAAALAGGSIDAAMPIDPFLTNIIEKNTGVLWKRTDELSPDFQSAVILYGPQFVKDNPDAARRFMVAYVKAARLYNDALKQKGSQQWNDVIDILIKDTAVKDRAMYDRLALPGLDPDGAVNVASIRLSQDWWVERDLQKDKIDLDRAIDLSYVKAAAQELGPYRR